jgi:hypothetical protein
MVNILIIPAISGILLFLTIALIEDYIIPKLSTDSKFRKWWRRHIIGTSEEYGD